MTPEIFETSFQPALLGLLRFGEAMTEIASLSPVVIALRTDVALAALGDPASVPAGEPVRMVAEKIDALAQCSAVVVLEFGLAAIRSLTELRVPLDGGLAIATAAMAPIRDRLRDNVARLGPGRLDAAARPAA